MNKSKKFLSVLLVAMMFMSIVPMSNMVIEANAISLFWPVPGHTRISQQWHNGNAIDISDGSIFGATVVAAMGGKVTHLRDCTNNHYGSMHNCNGFGTGIVIEGYDGRIYQYAHMLGNSIPSNVYVGAYVSAGDKIGAVGNTGNSSGAHLHFGISIGNYWNNSGIDPSKESYVYSNNWNNSDTKADLGTNFYAAILNTERNKALTVETNNNNNIAMYTYNGKSNQIWYFTKNDDGSYRITSLYNGESMDVCGGSSDSWVNVVTWTCNDTSAQKWNFYGNAPYMFITAECNTGVLDVADAKYEDGTNICINVKTGHNAQLFNVVKVNPPSIGEMTYPTITFDKKTYNVGDRVFFSWTKTAANTDFYQYWVIVQNTTTNKSYYSGATGANGDVSKNTCFFVAEEEGEYKITVYAVPHNNKNARQKMDEKYICVSKKHTHTFSFVITKVPSCYSNGVKTFECSCGYSYTETIKATGHSFGNYISDNNATFKTDGTKTSTCKNCGETKTVIDKGTRRIVEKPHSIKIAQNTSAIRLTWTKCAGATGYRIYYKSGNTWKICLNATTATSHTFTGLKAGSKFTFAVRPYIIADGTVIWSDYTQFTTATKPANPAVKVTSPSKGKISLAFGAVNGADGYQVFYKTGNGAYKLYNTFGKTGTLNFSNLKSGTKFTFAVRAGIKTSGGNIFGGYREVSVTVK